MKSTISAAILFFFCVCVIASAHGKSTSAYDGSKTEILPLAKQYLREGKLGEAKNLLNTLLSLEPYNASAHLLLGKAFLADKKYETACAEFGQAEQFATADEIASQANESMSEIPQKFKQPQPRGCLARTADQQTAPPQSGTILIFGARWQNQFKGLRESIDKLATESKVNLVVKPILLGEPDNQQMFELFSISELPAIVALDKRAEFAGGAAGKLKDAQIRALIKAAKK
jgi:thioredoxin-like negative regulator of GroEL